MTRKIGFSFVAGFLATLLFHQVGMFIFWKMGLAPNTPWDLSPNQAGMPKVLSLSFFGGLWGILMYFSLKKIRFYWLSHILFGAIFPTAVALLVVLPLKGIEFHPKMIPGGLILNGLWGWGSAIFYRAFRLYK